MWSWFDGIESCEEEEESRTRSVIFICALWPHSSTISMYIRRNAVSRLEKMTLP